MKYIKFGVNVLVCAIGLSSAIANAQNNTSLCFGDNDFVCINEVETAAIDGGHQASYYTIENKTTNPNAGQILAFGVTNSVGGDQYQAYLGSTYGYSWRAVTLSQAEWDAGEHAFSSKTSGGTDMLNAVTGADNERGLGSFSELFGAAVDENGNTQYVNFYWNTQNGAHHLSNGDSLTKAAQFNFYGLPESEATAIGFNRVVLATTVTGIAAPVPEPASALMLLLGLVLLVNRSIKAKSTDS